MSNGTSATVNGTKVQATEKVFDHAVDAVCAVGVVASASMGEANMATVGGLVSIALGKRVLSTQ